MTSDKRKRDTLSAAGAAALLLSCAVRPAQAQDPAPTLASPAQAAAEGLVLQLLADPDVQAAETRAEAQLAATPRGQTSAGAARIAAAAAEWTASVAFQVVARRQAEPSILWVTDDTPRTWLGHTLPGVGTSGDNPDNVYRQGVLDGAGVYDITGKVDLAHRPAQFSFEFDRETAIVPRVKINAASAGMGGFVAMITDRDLAIAPDGTFHITVNGTGSGPNHLALGPGLYSVGMRDTLSDWSQKPNLVTIRRLDPAPDQPVDYAALRQEVVADLGGYVTYWSAFPDIFFGGLAPNSVSAAIPREGGWGFLAGVHYNLGPGEALVVRTTDGGAQYTGFQVTDTWMIASDAKRYQTSLNRSQVRPDADGGYTYVISPQDPGVANWLDTSGEREGYGVLRWQAAPAGVNKDALVRDARVVRIADLANWPGLARVAPDQRKDALIARADGYANRTR